MAAVKKQNTFTAEGIGGPIHVIEKGNYKTAFGELLVGQLHPICQGSFEYTVDNTDLNTNTVTNGGTVTQVSAMAVIGTSTTTNSTALLQTRQHARYRSGMGGVTRFTDLFTAPVAGTEQYIGLADETGTNAAFKNGYMVGYDGLTYGYHRFQNDVKITTALADWDDPLDGTGPSGMTINHTKLNVCFIPFQYLGGGAIGVYVESDIDNKMFLAHVDSYANQNTEPSAHNPNFYFTIWANNGSTTSDMVLKCSSYGYFIEGITSHIELQQFHNSSSAVEKTTVTSEVAILTIRNRATYASKTNFIDVLLAHFTASIQASSANNLGTIRLVINATLGGTPSWADINTSDSVLELDTAGTTVTGGKEIMNEPLAGKNDKFSEHMNELQIIMNPGDSMTIAGSSGNDATIRGSLLFKELF